MIRFHHLRRAFDAGVQFRRALGARFFDTVLTVLGLIFCRKRTLEDEFEGYTEEQLADEAARDFDDALKEAVSQVEGPRESRCRGWA